MRISAGADPQPQPVGAAARRGGQAHGMAEPLSVSKVDRADAANALYGNALRGDAHAEGRRRQNGQFRAGVETVDIGAGVAFRITQLLRLLQDCVERLAPALHFSENEIRSPVEDARQRLDAVAGDALAQRRQYGNAARNRGLHSQAHVARRGPIPQRGSRLGDQLLVGGDDGLPGGDRGFDDLFGGGRPADELGDDGHVGPGDQFAPIARAQRFGMEVRFAGRLLVDAPRADRPDFQRKAQLARNRLRVFVQDAKRSAADIAEPNYANADFRHKLPF